MMISINSIKRTPCFEAQSKEVREMIFANVKKHLLSKKYDLFSIDKSYNFFLKSLADFIIRITPVNPLEIY